jgi:hypothetical protein
MDRPIAALVGPQAGHGDDPVVDLADRPQVLAGHMGGCGAVLAVTGVVDHQRTRIVRGGGQVLAQQPHALVVDLLVIPGRLGQEPLQPLDLTVLRAHHGFGAGQPGQGLVAVAGQQQALQVVTEPAALGQAREQGVKPLGVVLERAGRGWARTAGGHRGSWLLAAGTTMDRTAGAYPRLNKLPVKRFAEQLEGPDADLLPSGSVVLDQKASGADRPCWPPRRSSARCR